MTSFARHSMETRDSDAPGPRRGSSAKPLVLLLLALATLLLFDGRGQPVHGAHRAYHEHMTWHHMAIAQNLSQDRAHRAAAFSDFALLRRSEQRTGFSETPARAQRFFRSGKAGDGRRLLSAAQVDAVVRAHGRTMATLGYC